MPNCAVLSCKNSTKNVSRDNGNVSFHRFPSDPKVKAKWIEATGQKHWFPTKFSRICSVHFNEGNFTETKKFRRLASEAVPTIDVLKTSTDDEEIHEMSTSNEDTQSNTPTEKKLLQKLNISRQKIKEQTMHIKRLREQNRRKDLKILKLVSIIENLKRESFVRDRQPDLLNTVTVVIKEEREGEEEECN